MDFLVDDLGLLLEFLYLLSCGLVLSLKDLGLGSFLFERVLCLL